MCEIYMDLSSAYILDYNICNGIIAKCKNYVKLSIIGQESKWPHSKLSHSGQTMVSKNLSQSNKTDIKITNLSKSNKSD